MRLGNNIAFSRSGRPAGNSGVWTPPVSLKARAPRAFRSALRAPLHARETLLPRSLDAPRASASHSVLLCATQQGFPRLPAWAPGRCPPAGCRRVGASLAAGAASASRLPPSPPSTLLGQCAIAGGGGQRCPSPTFSLRLTWLPYVARLLPSDCAPMACAVMARTVARPCAVRGSWPRLPASAHGPLSAARVRHPPMATLTQAAQTARTVGTLCAPSAGPFGLRPRLRPCVLAWWPVSGVRQGDGLRKYGGKQMPPQRQDRKGKEGALNLGTRSDWKGAKDE